MAKQASIWKTFFENATASRKFLKDYALNEGKSINQTISTGSRKGWSCSSSTECPWHVVLAMRHGNDLYKTKRSEIPRKKWYIKCCGLQLTDLCDSLPDVTAEQLKLMPGFQASLVDGCETAFKRVVESLRKTHKLDVSGKISLVYRSIAQEIAVCEADISRQIEYDELTSFLTCFSSNNPGSRTCCQLDSKGRFYRGFLSIGFLVDKRDCFLPVFETDGTHMKHKLYNGVCLTVLGKYGDGNNIPLAIGFVHKETKWNFACFFANCVAAGIRLQDAAMFSVRGKQLDAQKLLVKLGIQIHLKFCALHIIFNVCHYFKAVDDDIQRVKAFVYKLQACTSLRGYNSVLGEIREEFPVPVKPNSKDEKYVADYLHAIHLTCWTRFGNCQLTADEKVYFSTHWQSEDSYGSPKPLYGWRTTSGVEGENNALLLDGVRTVTVPEAFRLFCLRVLKVVKEKESVSAHWIVNKHTVTPRAKALYDNEKNLAPNVVATKSSPSEYYAVEHFSVVYENVTATNSRSFSVNLETMECHRCSTRQLLRIPCRHILSALYSRKMKEDISLVNSVEQCFQRAYTCSVYQQAFRNFSLSIPVEADLNRDVLMCPPPRYRQAGGSIGLRRAVKDRQKIQNASKVEANSP